MVRGEYAYTVTQIVINDIVTLMYTSVFTIITRNQNVWCSQGMRTFSYFDLDICHHVCLCVKKTTNASF